MKKIIITIDGHSACGKSTLAKALALELDYGYIDTGAMYRAVTYFFLENRVNIQKTAELERALKKIKITFKSTVAGNRTYLNGKDVEDVIRKMFVSKNVSHVATISPVRKIVVKQQKEMGKQKGIVMEGRDIGTVVFPKAELKIFLTADEDIRAQRRYEELKNKGQRVSLKAIKSNLLERDHIDSTRKDSPLKKAKEAVAIDNSNLSQREQLTMVLALAKERIRKFSLDDKKQTPVKAKRPQSQNKPTQKSTRSANTNRNANSKTQRNTPKKETVPAQKSQNKPTQKSTRSANTNRNANSKTQRNTPKKGTTPAQKSQNKPTQKSTRSTNTNRNANSNTQRNTPQKGTTSPSNTKKEKKTNPKAPQQNEKKTVSQRRVYKKPPTDKKSS